MSTSRELINAADEAESPYFVGVDVGGTNIKIGLVDNRGRTLAYRRMPTEVEKGPEDGTQRMGKAIAQIIDESGVDVDEVKQVGLGTPGTMDLPAGMLLEPHNLPGWFNFPIRDRLQHHCGKPVTFANDAGAAAFGEYWCGTGKEFRSLIVLTLGTGIGGGIILDGKSLDGHHGHGAECGHIIIDYHDDARICPCGEPGHLEAYASATGLIARTEEALSAGRTSSLQSLREKGGPISPLQVGEAAEAGDALALELVMETARYLGVGVVSLLHTVDPDGVVLGGAMTFGGKATRLGRAFLERVRDEVRQRAFPVLVEQIVVDFASLGGDAGYIGAAGLARSAYLARDK